MFRLAGRIAVVIALTAALATGSAALTLIAPTEGQIVRENVKIQVPADAVPDDPQTPGFISLYVGEPPERKFVAGISRRSGKEVAGTLVFYWNSKASYQEPAHPGRLNYFKDGLYPLLVQVHDSQGKLTDSATVSINLQNKIPRTNPAPGVRLVNRLSFGEANTYGVHAQVGVFESAAAVDLPILGGLGISSDLKIHLSVEDVRPTGEVMVRYRIGEDAYVSMLGNKTLLYAGQLTKPQLYSLVTKYGGVVTANLFKKQARFTIMGVLPRLPNRLVKEGDTWPDAIGVKVEGLTEIAKLEGTASLDSFEWQSGRECAKIVSRLSGPLNVTLAGGKVTTTGEASAEVTTYFAYKSGRMIKREIALDVPASIAPGAGEMLEMAVPVAPVEEASETTGPMLAPPPMMSSPYGEGDRNYGPSPMPTRPTGPTTATVSTREPGAKKGKVKIDLVVRLEK